MFFGPGHHIMPVNTDGFDDLFQDMEQAMSGSQAASALELPDFLQTPQGLAQMIYEFWVNSMETDGLEFAGLVMHRDDGLEGERIHPSNFADLPADVRMNFVEAIQVNITEPLKRIVRDLAQDRAKMDAILNEANAEVPADLAVPVFFPCYCCGKMDQNHAVGSPGHACNSCLPRRR